MEGMEGPQAEAKTVLVTGGSGFLGGWCAVEALRRGHRVRTTVRDLARESEVRAVISSQVDAGDRLAVLAADLRDDDGWAQAVEGCDRVLHVASPFPPTQPKDPDELIVPAREGTLRVLRAALEAGVGRVVVTSSVAAVSGARERPARPLTEEDWSDPDNPRLTPYARSKTIAERAAWDLVRERDEPGRLATVNPGAILGPALSDDLSYSLEVIERLLRGMPGVPRIGFSFVDVRDVADLHLRAMAAPEAGGERFIAGGPFLWMSEVAAVLREHLGEAAAKVPERTVPNLLVRAMGIADPGIRSVVRQLGRKTEVSSEKAETRLGWSPRPVEETIVDCARSLIEQGVVAAG
jgi:dihydroflavonol-4-reductase